MVLYKNINFVLVCAIVLLVGICVWLNWNNFTTKVKEEKVKEEVKEEEKVQEQVKLQNLDTWETHLFRLQTHGLGYPPTIKSRFFYETSVCGSDPSSSVYQSRWIESPELDLIETQDYTPFLEQIQDGSDINQIARSFYNKSGDTLLIIPYPHQTIQYPTIKEFIDQAPPETKSEFWKFVVDQIKQFILTHGQVYVSTHGLGVSYFHLLLCTSPKYYHSQDII
jgi:hypothetical protein